MSNDKLFFIYQELFAKYPLSFRNHDAEDTQFMNGVHWPEEWLPLVDQTCTEIEKYLLSIKDTSKPASLPRIVQIKEKFGELKINIIPCDENLSKIRRNAALQSKTCENHKFDK